MSRLVSRSIGLSTAAAAVVLLCRPRQVAQLAAGNPGSSPPGWVVQVLGARYLAQAAAELSRPTPAVWALVSAVDGLHAASMVAAAAWRPRYRRAALVNAAIATGSAAVTAIHGWRSR